MTFREFMIQKLDASNPETKTDIEKYVVYRVKNHTAKTAISIWIPDNGNKYFEMGMRDAMEQYAMCFTDWGHSMVRTLAELVIEYLGQEASAKEESK